MSLIDDLYKKDNILLRLRDKAKTLYRLSRYLYSRVEEYPDDKKRDRLIRANEELVYDIGALMVLFDPDSKVDSLKKAYEEISVLPMPMRTTYVFPTIEQIDETANGLFVRLEELFQTKADLFNHSELTALGKLMDTILDNILTFEAIIYENRRKTY